eukprot:scaffold2484_cov261-Pinguiococcus_pyrenoidosus.AAC.2
MSGSLDGLFSVDGKDIETLSGKCYTCGGPCTGSAFPVCSRLNDIPVVLRVSSVDRHDLLPVCVRSLLLRQSRRVCADRCAFDGVPQERERERENLSILGRGGNKSKITATKMPQARSASRRRWGSSRGRWSRGRRT